MDLPRIKIPVFVSSPSDLSPKQEEAAKIIQSQLRKNKLEWRALGRNEFPDELPLREVLRMVKHCSGGVILGFEQFRSSNGGIYKRGSGSQKRQTTPVVMPTPWNQLEAGILFAQQVPVLIFREEGVKGGVFDVGTSEVFIHNMPNRKMNNSAKESLDMVFQKWTSKVHAHYYGT